MSRSKGLALHLSDADESRWSRRVARTAACWVWMGAVGSDGYGRFSLTGPERGHGRTVTPHQVAARLAFGPTPIGATLMHDCDVRICVSTERGHLRVATQGENMVQAAHRGRAAGPRPGLVDVRGKAGASRAVQEAIRGAVGADRAELAVVLAQCLAAGDPWRQYEPLFPLPPGHSLGERWDEFPADLLDPRAAAAPITAVTIPLFNC